MNKEIMKRLEVLSKNIVISDLKSIKG